MICGSLRQRNDIAFAHELVDGFEADHTIAKATTGATPYDADAYYASLTPIMLRCGASY